MSVESTLAGVAFKGLTGERFTPKKIMSELTEPNPVKRIRKAEERVGRIGQSFRKKILGTEEPVGRTSFLSAVSF